MNVVADFLNSGIRMTTPILFAAIASLISARAGILNLAIESKVLLGSFTGILVAAWTGSPLAGVLAASLSGALIGAIMALAHRFEVDLVVLAIGLNILVLQLTVFLMRSFLGGVGTYKPDVSTLTPITVPLLGDLPFVGHLLNRWNVLVYAAFLLVGLLALWFRTRAGRHLLAVGEAPGAAASSGLPVARTQVLALIVAGAIAGLGGSFLSVGDLGMFTRNMSADRGWIGITAALLALNRPGLLIPAAGVFGLASAASIRLQQFDVPASLTQFLPQGAAFVALVLVGLRARSRGRFLQLWRSSSRIPLSRRRAPVPVDEAVSTTEVEPASAATTRTGPP
ncbi:ABC transporter permease [Brachybacterium horti]|uniref:ABC transporter permease n=1 Tax=Brachybacterium rhamnosum TaxID=173361 RepID=A0ABW4PUM7_9MICO|nr:ABC transporter permease [Brachybacterium sp. SGAir0954]QCR52219.1 sugar ABC transporter permease [Brachybacterium sp. SGAir0954]